MFFFIGFAWFVAASFAFVIAILTPNWLILQTSDGTINVQRGIFFMCDLVSVTNTSTTTRCVSMIQQGSSTNPVKWKYEFAIACASLAIACAALSIIVIWLSGIYFHVRQRTKKTLCFLLFIDLIILIIFCISFIVWILLISETLVLGYSVNSNIFNWPMWLAVGATGGYFISFITILFSFCAICQRQKKIEKNHYHPKTHF